MKKLLLLLLLGIILVPTTQAAEQETNRDRTIVLVSIQKTNGGFLSIFNLYNNVTYTVGESTITTNNEVIYAVLDCSGPGFIPCRLPVDASISNNNNNLPINPELATNAINSLIEFSESEYANGICFGKESKKISCKVNGQNKIYIFNASWNYDRDGSGNGTMEIRIIEEDYATITL